LRHEPPGRSQGEYRSPKGEGFLMGALHVVVMGVAGCGKSAVGERLASALALALIEGDSFHPAGNIVKMQRGIALTDDDRAGWLALLGEELARHPAGAVLTCSALKRSYRDSLRAPAPGLRFVHLALGREDAQERVARRAGHFYPTSLVASQFEALEDPSAESGVIVVDAVLPLPVVVDRALQALKDKPDSTIRN
jgi:gluconokinase